MTCPLTTLRRIVHGGITHGQAQDLARACLASHGVDLSPVGYQPGDSPQLADLPAPDPAPRRRLTIAAHHVAIDPQEDPNGVR